MTWASLDERLFLYYEDFDLSWRGQARGWRYRYVPASVVHHAHTASTVEGSALFDHYVERNRLLVHVKNAPAGYAAHVALSALWTAIVIFRRHVVRRTLTGKRPEWTLTRRRLRSFAAFLRLLPSFVVTRMRLRGRQRRPYKEQMNWLVPLSDLERDGESSALGARASGNPFDCRTTGPRTLKQRVLHPRQSAAARRLHALRDVSFEVERGRVLRHHRAQRLRQEHAAQVPRRDLPARPRAGRGRRARLALHRARRRLQPRADRARQRRRQRRAARHAARRGARAVRRRSSRFAELERVRRPEAEELLVRDAGAARRSRRRSRPTPTSTSSTRCWRSATRASRRSASTPSGG